MNKNDLEQMRDIVYNNYSDIQFMQDGDSTLLIEKFGDVDGYDCAMWAELIRINNLPELLAEVIAGLLNYCTFSYRGEVVSKPAS